MKTQNTFKKYKESGRVPPTNLMVIFLIGVFGMFLLGFLYSYLISFIPFIYFNILVVIGFAYAIAHSSRYLNVTFKIRNKTASMVITGILVLLATYFQWVFYIYIISYDKIAPINDFSFIVMDLIFDPRYIVEMIIDLNNVGAWDIGSVTYKGSLLWFIWLSEIILTLGISFKIYNKFESKPFSEKDNQWFTVTKIHNDFEFIHLKRTFLEEFYKNPAEALNSLDKGNGTRQSNVFIFSSKSRDVFLISIENSIVNNKGRKEYSNILEPCFLDRNHLTAIKEKFTVA